MANDIFEMHITVTCTDDNIHVKLDDSNINDRPFIMIACIQKIVDALVQGWVLSAVKTVTTKREGSDNAQT